MIYLLCSTIRPNEFKRTHTHWMNMASNFANIKTKLVVDKQEHVDELSEFDTLLYSGQTVGITKPLVYLTQSLVNLKPDDIIVVMSDDFFAPKNWDLFLKEQFKDFNGAIKVHDGGEYSERMGIITIPIMTYACLEKLNHIVYHPAYNHMYSDNELRDVLFELNMLKIVDPKAGYTFEHRHWTNGKRPVDRQDAILNGTLNSQDAATYAKRKQLSLEDKLRI